MFHLLTEENSELRNRSFPLADGIRKHLQSILDSYQGDKTIDGYKRLNNILSTNVISYLDMKRIKNFFDHYEGTDSNPEFILNGGEAMKLWVNNTLNTARQDVYNVKQAKKDMGIKNAFRKTHTKDRNNLVTPDSIKHSLGEGKTKHTFIITEAQLEEFAKLYEARDDSFNIEELSQFRRYTDKVRYCTQHLGAPMGKGSGRMVFQLDDEKILKLAYNQKGVAQNSEEAMYGQNNYFTFFPQVYEQAQDDSWIIAEAVLPAKKQDFDKVLGISWDDFCSFVYSVWVMADNRNSRYNAPSMTREQADGLEKNNYDLSKIAEYIRSEKVPSGDLERISSWGLTNRNGEPEIVLLDSGLTKSVSDKYYTKK